MAASWTNFRFSCQGLGNSDRVCGPAGSRAILAGIAGSARRSERCFSVSTGAETRGLGAECQDKRQGNYSGWNGRRRRHVRVGAASRRKNYGFHSAKVGLCAGDRVQRRRRCFIPVPGEGNFLPEKAPDANAWPAEIDLSGKSGTFSIGSPFGVDTYILLTTADQIADLSAFNFSGVLQATRGGPQSPLAQLLGQRERECSRGQPCGPRELVRPIHADSQHRGGKTSGKTPH